MDLCRLFDLSDDRFRERFRATPLWRSRRRGMLRNAAIVLGNQRAEGAVPVLRKGLSDPEPLVRAACVWALAQFSSSEATGAWQELAARETDEDVVRELRRAASSLAERLR
jgi:epoxyqueuosine reductase